MNEYVELRWYAQKMSAQKFMVTVRTTKKLSQHCTETM